MTTRPPLGAPPALERIVRRCLAKQVGQRFPSMHEVKVALEEMSIGSDTQTAIDSPSCRSRT